MRALQVIGQPEVARGRVVAVDQADDLVFEQQGGAQVLRRLRPVADDDVEFAFGQCGVEVILGTERLQDEACARGCRSQVVDHRGYQRWRQIVGGADAESLSRGSRVERIAGRQQRIELAQH
jgi:hypothetical protein